MPIVVNPFTLHEGADWPQLQAGVDACNQRLVRFAELDAPEPLSSEVAGDNA